MATLFRRAQCTDAQHVGSFCSVGICCREQLCSPTREAGERGSRVILLLLMRWFFVLGVSESVLLGERIFIAARVLSE
jgi:hypothetical protein